MPSIPVIDCAPGILSKSAEIVDAIHRVGFVYLINFGIPPAEVDETFAVGDKFWALDESVKAKYARSLDAGGVNTGYVGPGRETLDPHGRQELREAYNITPEEDEHMVLPEEECPELTPRVMEFYRDCCGVATDVLRALGKELLPSQPDFLVDKHLRIVKGGGNPTSLRLLRYPPLSQHSEATRCGEHTDYGTLTLLFQDDVGGLEVQSECGEWVKAEPVAGAVLINTGDLMEIWTGGRIKAVRHRVIPSSHPHRARRSIVLFLHPDHPSIVEPIRGVAPDSPEREFPAVVARDHLLHRFTHTYLAPDT